MAPDATHTPMVKRNKNAYGQHARLALGMFIWLIQECTESGIFLVNEISIFVFSSQLAVQALSGSPTSSPPQHCEAQKEGI
jgi:hypothetical protein